MQLLPKPKRKPLPRYDESATKEVFDALDSLDESLSTRTFGIIGFALAVVASLGAAATTGHVAYKLFITAVLLLAVAACAAGSSLIRGRTTTRWQVGVDAKVFAEQEAGRISQRVVATQVALVFLVAASVATAAAALQALHFKDTGEPVSCDVTIPAAAKAGSAPAPTTTTPHVGVVECHAG